MGVVSTDVTADAVASDGRAKPSLVFFYSSLSGHCRRVEGFLAQVLQRRRNHDTFKLYRVDDRERPDLLERFGVEAVPTVGERFDPHIHEAVTTEETDEVEPDTVTQEMQRGYRLGDKLLRLAMVKVATRG